MTFFVRGNSPGSLPRLDQPPKSPTATILRQRPFSNSDHSPTATILRQLTAVVLPSRLSKREALVDLSFSVFGIQLARVSNLFRGTSANSHFIVTSQVDAVSLRFRYLTTCRNSQLLHTEQRAVFDLFRTSIANLATSS